MQTAANAATRRVHMNPKAEHIAFYESATKVAAAAKAEGFTGDDGESWHDFVEGRTDRYQTAKSFTTLREAVSWLRAEVKAGRSFYGCGTVRLIEMVEQRDRCRYCVCGGIRHLHEWIVTDDGVEQDDALDSICAA